MGSKQQLLDYNKRLKKTIVEKNQRIEDLEATNEALQYIVNSNVKPMPEYKRQWKQFISWLKGPIS